MDLSGFIPDTYYKAATYAGLVVFASALAAGDKAFSLTGIGIALAGIGEWTHIRRYERPVSETTSGYVVVRQPSPASVALLLVGVLLALVGIAGAIKGIFWG